MKTEMKVGSKSVYIGSDFEEGDQVKSVATEHIGKIGTVIKTGYSECLVEFPCRYRRWYCDHWLALEKRHVKM